MKNSMFRIIRVNLVACCLVVPFAAQAGEREGHGGVSIVCRNQVGQIASVELLDTFEGNNQYNLKIGGSELPIEDQIEAAQNRLVSRPEILENFQVELAHVQAHIQFLKEGVGLNPTDDAFPLINKKGCKYEQLAVYTDAGQVLVDAELYGSLSKTDQAALYVHETIYKMARARGAKSSVESRKLTAYLFTRPNQPAVIRQLLISMFVPPPPPLQYGPLAYQRVNAGYYWTTHPEGCGFEIIKSYGTLRLKYDKGCPQGNGITFKCTDEMCMGDLEGRFQSSGHCTGSDYRFELEVRLIPHFGDELDYVEGTDYLGSYGKRVWCEKVRYLYAKYR